MRRVVVVVLAVAALNVLTTRTRLEWDLTAERSATLSDATRRVLRRVDRPLRVTAFFGRDEPGRVEAVTLLSRYRKANRRVSFRVLDPAQAPGEARRLGIVASGSAGLHMSGRTEVAQDAIEIDITSAIARLLRDASGTVCFTTGHGERAVADRSPRGMSIAARMLRDNGYHVLDADLLVEPVPPSGCDALVLASPESSPGEPALTALHRYLGGAGKLLVMMDPESAVDPSPLTEPFGIGFARGIVLEGDPGSRLRDDPTAPIVSRFFAANPAVRGLPPTYHPGAQAVVVRDPDRPSLSVAALAETTSRAYLERDPGGEVAFDPAVDLAGPVTLGAAADDSRVEEIRGSPAIRRTRIVAWGDVDFASNAFLTDGGNARLLLQSIDWLTQPEPLIGAVPTFPSVRELRLTEARLRYVAFVTAGFVPGLFLLAGALVWALRRGR